MTGASLNKEADNLADETPKNDETRSVTRAGHEGLGAKETGECLDKSNTADAQGDQPQTPEFEITIFRKENGRSISKHISLNADGEVVKDGSHCAMSSGAATRRRFRNLSEFAALVSALAPCEAIALGRLRQDIGESALLVAEDRRERALDGTISRTKQYLGFRPGAPAIMLLDYDLDSVTAKIRARVEELGGFVQAIRHIIPGFENVGYVERKSTSSALFNEESLEEFEGSGGVHLYVPVADGSDIKRALEVIQARAWLAGFGAIKVSKSAAVLVRSIVDISVGAPERLIFEGAPTLAKPLKQHPRDAIAIEGDVLDTHLALGDLTVDEKRLFERMVSAAEQAVKPVLDEIREIAIERAVADAIARGVPEARARDHATKTYSQSANRILFPTQSFLFDDPQIGTVSGGDILANPENFAGKTCADPLEVNDKHGRVMRNKAVVVVGEQHGDVLVYSQLHGGIRYILRHDEGSIRDAIEKATPCDLNLVPKFIEMMCAGDGASPVSEAVESTLLELVGKKTKAGKKAVKAELKKARDARTAHRRESGIANNDTRRVVVVDGNNLAQTADEVLRVLVEGTTDISNKSGQLVIPGWVEYEQLRHGRKFVTQTPCITVLSSAALLDHLTREISFVRNTAKGPVPALPPKALLDAILSRTQYPGLQTLRCVVAAPFLRADGTIASAEGLDARTGIFHHRDPRCDLTHMIATPTRDDALTAVKTLRELLVEFPFADRPADGSTGVDESVILAGILTCFVAGAVNRAPGFGVTANAAGTGKSYVFTLISLLATGRDAAMHQAPKDDHEFDTIIEGAVMEGQAHLFVDNVTKTLGNSARFCQVLTQRWMKIRPFFSKGADLEIENILNVWVNGINLRVTDDVTRRFLLANLVTSMERPEQRRFETSPEDLIRRDRGRYVGAALTIMRAYACAGFPDVKGRDGKKCAPLASYEDWSRYVRQALVFAGCADPVASQEALREGDPTRDLFRRVAESWSSFLTECNVSGKMRGIERHGIAVGDVIKQINLYQRYATDPDGDESAQEKAARELWSAMREIAPHAKDDVQIAAQLGTWLKKHEGRIFGNRQFLSERHDGEKTNRWILKNLSAADLGDDLA